MNQMLNTPLVKIGVVGVGGAGCNAVNMMLAERLSSESDTAKSYSIFNDITIIAANTDAQDLQNSPAEKKIQLGTTRSSGLGAGGKPEVGRQAAEESKVEIAQALEGFDMVFITAGMGGGTGTGAAPIIAQIAKESGILTIGVVTMPFNFEGKMKMKIAEEGVSNLKAAVDTLVVIPNQKLVEIANNSDSGASLKEMFQRSNVVLLDAVRNIAEVISVKSYINVDFADVKSVMTDLGIAMIGFGSATGENAAINAVKEALNNPLLSDISIKGATRALLHLGGMNIPLIELTEASEYVSSQIHEDAFFIWGASADETSDRVYALIVAEAAKEKDVKKTTVYQSAKKVEAKDQSTFYDVAEASGNKEKIRNILTAEIKDSLEENIHHHTAASANKTLSASATAAKFDKIEDDDIMFQIPEDLNDISIPAYLRKKREFVIKESIDANDLDSVEKAIFSSKNYRSHHNEE